MTLTSKVLACGCRATDDRSDRCCPLVTLTTGTWGHAGCQPRGVMIESWSVLTPISVHCWRVRVPPDRQWCSSGGSSVDESRISLHY
jgi:hypothetical protein